MSAQVSIFEVGPRDGLQNESKILSLEDKIWFIQKLVQAGLKEIEVGAFVRSDRVPQMAQTELIYEAITQKTLVMKPARHWVLVPNQKGLERAIEVKAKNIALFTAVTDGFNKANIGMTVTESFTLYEKLIPEAKKAGMKIRGYVSTAFGCPYEGKVAPKKALKVIERLAQWKLDQISIGDTIGVATPKDVENVIHPALKTLKAQKTAVHFHDTRGTALANALKAYEMGVRIFDSSAGGLGGCPYAPGASGNLATEDLVYMFEGMGVKTGVKLELLADVSVELSRRMGRALLSKFVQAHQKSIRKRG